MKRKILFFTGLLFLFNGLFAQIELKGRVLDAATNEPIYNVHVYLAGTTIGTVTDTAGFYEIKVITRIHTDLVASHILYEKMVISQPYDSLPEVIRLPEKMNLLDEVAVLYKDKFSWEEKMEAFRKEFLGTSKNALSCQIKNEADLILIYKEESKTLIALPTAPLEIYNPHLGYTILWDNVEFSIQYTDETLSPKKIALLTMIGYPSFRDEKTSRKIEERRKYVYQISKRCFFRNLAEGKATWPQYRLQDTNRRSMSHTWEHWFVVKDDPDDSSFKHVTIYPQFKDNKGKMSLIVESNYRKAVINGKLVNLYSSSQLDFFVDTFRIDAYGNTDLMKNLYQFGEMGKQRLGDMVPLNYEMPY